MSGHYDDEDLAHQADMRKLRREQLEADISVEEANEELEEDLLHDYD